MNMIVLTFYVISMFKYSHDFPAVESSRQNVNRQDRSTSTYFPIVAFFFLIFIILWYWTKKSRIFVKS